MKTFLTQSIKHSFCKQSSQGDSWEFLIRMPSIQNNKLRSPYLFTTVTFAAVRARLTQCGGLMPGAPRQTSLRPNPQSWVFWHNGKFLVTSLCNSDHGTIQQGSTILTQFVECGKIEPFSVPVFLTTYHATSLKRDRHLVRIYSK